MTEPYPAAADAVGATDVIEADDPRIREVAERVAGAAEGTKAARLLFEWVRDEIGYDMTPDVETRDDWKATATLERGYGFCQQKAVLLATLLRAKGIPAGILVQDLLDHKIPPHYVEVMGSQRLEVHGLTIAYLDGQWRRLDATLPRAMVEKKGYRLVEFQEEGDSVLQETDAVGKPHFDVLEELGAWPDLPQEIVEQTMAIPYLKTDQFRQIAQRYGPGM